MICPHCQKPIGGIQFVCANCGQEKPEADFQKRMGGPSTWCARCREIKTEKMKIRRALDLARSLKRL